MEARRSPAAPRSRTAFFIWTLTIAAAACVLQTLLQLVSAEGFNSEVDALMAFKNGLLDPQGAMADWDANAANPCTFVRVDCDDNNKVVRLSLGAMGISGTISPRVGDLSSLQYLELFRNDFFGPIPAEIGKLSKLVALHLFNNALTGQIPPQLQQLSNLQFLDLSNNQLSGPIPSGGAMAKFPASSYAGNPDLCGPILDKPCGP